MIKEVRTSLVMLIVFTILTGLVYPYLMAGIGQALFPHQAMGSLAMRDGKVIGSELIGQQFASDRYFHGRPSAITTTDAKGNTVPDPYDPTSSSGSNLGPTSKALISRVQGDAQKLKAERDAPIPVDLVTTSASGLDPDITPAAAEFQVPRVAKARHLPEQRVRALAAAATTPRLFGLFGEPHVNVLSLNLALDAAGR